MGNDDLYSFKKDMIPVVAPGKIGAIGNAGGMHSFPLAEGGDREFSWFDRDVDSEERVELSIPHESKSTTERDRKAEGLRLNESNGTWRCQPSSFKHIARKSEKSWFDSDDDMHENDQEVFLAMTNGATPTIVCHDTDIEIVTKNVSPAYEGTCQIGTPTISLPPQQGIYSLTCAHPVIDMVLVGPSLQGMQSTIQRKFFLFLFYYTLSFSHTFQFLDVLTF